MKKKASVVVTMYNGARFLEEQLETIRKQTYPNIEVIIADDVSNDDSVRIAERYIQKYKLQDIWRVIVNPYNKGYSKNFLDVCKETKGDVIFFCDQDDKWNIDKIEVMMHTLEEHSEISLLACNLVPFIEEKGARKLNSKFLAEMKNDNSVEVFGVTADSFHCKRSGCTMCVRRSFYDKIMPYWVINWAHDEFVWKMACVNNCCGIVHNVGVQRRMHINNVTNVKEKTRNERINQISNMIECSESWLKYAIDEKSTETIIKKIKIYKESLEMRKKMLIHRNILIWFVLWRKFAEYYPRKKGLYLDLFLILFEKFIKY